MAGKADIVDHLANSLEWLTKKQAAETFDTVIDYMIKVLSEDDRVQIPGFGNFSVTERKERQGRNPKTREVMTIPASNSVRFKIGRNLKEAINK